MEEHLRAEIARLDEVIATSTHENNKALFVKERDGLQAELDALLASKL